MAPRTEQVIGWFYLAVAMGALVWAAAAGAWLIALNTGFLWVLVLGSARKLQKLEAAVTKQTEELAAHVAAREVTTRRRTDPWLAASRGQH